MGIRRHTRWMLTETADIGNARIAGLADDLKIDSDQYEWLLWAFYMSYILFEWMMLLSVSATQSLEHC